jgi:surfeit locus 1 family protein
MDSYMNDSLVPNVPDRKRCRPAWVPALTALFFALFTAWLGHWQLDRAQQKRELQARYDASANLPPLELNKAPTDWSDLLYRRVRVSGRFGGAYQVYIDNRIYHDRAGYFVLAPLRFSGGALLVNRGWLAAAGDRSIPPQAPTAKGVRMVEGILVPARSRFLELSANSIQGAVWENLDLDRYRRWYGPELPELVLLQTSAADDGLVRDWPRPGLGIERHLGYAAQWFSMTAAIAVLYLYFGLWRRSRGEN